MTENPKQSGKSIVRNVFFGVSTWILPLALSFVATPVIVGALGHDDYGIYALVLGFIAYSFNFNVGRAITKYVAEFRPRGDFKQIREIISATAAVNLVVGFAGLLVIVFTAGTIVKDVLRIAPEAHEKSVTALYVAALTIFFLMVNQIFNAVLQGVQRFDLYAKIFNINNFLVIGGNLVLAWNGYGLNGLLLWNLAVTILSAATAAIFARQVLPEIGFSLKFQRDSLRRVLVYSRWVILYQVMANVLLLFERAWITAKLGPESLTYYVVPMTLGLYIQSFMSSLMLVLFPLASELTGDPAKLLRLYQKSTKIVVFLTVFMATSLIVLSKPFLTAWMGAEFAANSAALLVVHAVTFGLLGIAVVAWQMTEGLGFPNYNCYIFVNCFIVGIIGMIWLTPYYGVYGVAIARLLGFSLLFGSVFFLERRFFGHVQMAFWAKLASVVAIAGTLSGVTEYFVQANFSPGWIAILTSVTAGGVVFCLTAWFLGFFSRDEIEMLRRIAGRQERRI